MPCDLEVDTDQIRRASGLLTLAAGVLTAPSSRWGLVTGVERTAAGPAAFREAVRSAVGRADQVLACLGALGARADTLSGSLRTAAAGFERAEALCAAGR